MYIAVKYAMYVLLLYACTFIFFKFQAHTLNYILFKF